MLGQPPLANPGDFYIILILKDGSKEGHWSFLMKTEKGYISFDSFGFPRDLRTTAYISQLEHIDKEDSSMAYNITTSKEDIQNYRSSHCGAYLLFVLDTIFSSGLSSYEDGFNEALRQFDPYPSNKNVELLIDHFS